MKDVCRSEGLAWLIFIHPFKLKIQSMMNFLFLRHSSVKDKPSYIRLNLQFLFFFIAAQLNNTPTKTVHKNLLMITGFTLSKGKILQFEQ